MLAPRLSCASRRLMQNTFANISELQLQRVSVKTSALSSLLSHCLVKTHSRSQMLSRGFANEVNRFGSLTQSLQTNHSLHAVINGRAATVNGSYIDNPIGVNADWGKSSQTLVQSGTPTCFHSHCRAFFHKSTVQTSVSTWPQTLPLSLHSGFFRVTYPLANRRSKSSSVLSSSLSPPSFQSARSYTTREANPSPSVSVRSPHGAGTERLSEGLRSRQNGLRRVDTDQAAEHSSSSPSAVKDVLWGRKQQAYTPIAPPPTDEQIQALHDFIVGSEKLLVVTGAGVSTESGIPDYRSPTGAYSTGFKPMTHQEFCRSAASRQRYWARSYFGWRRFFGTKPNETHRALATLEERGRVQGGMITQNVDRLHHACGSQPLELHGTTHQVICMSCQNLSDRQEFQEKLAAVNPQWIDSIEAAERGEDVLAGTPGLQRPDGDVEIGEEFLRKGLFKVPLCEKCGADALKPDVVFFGDNVPKWRVDRAMAMVRDSDAMLVVGSSLMVLSAFRLARAAADADTPIAILNVGPTRADDLASLRVGARSGEVLSRLLRFGALTLPL